MIKLIVERSISRGAGIYLGELYADTAAELAGVTDVDGVTLDSGSLALTADGEVCVLDSEGVWHKKDGTAITTGGDSDD